MQFKTYTGIFTRIAVIALCFLFVLSASRLILVGIYWDRVAPTEGFITILLMGIRFDLILVASLLGPVALALPWFHLTRFGRWAGPWVLPVYTGIISAVAFFVEASSASFITQFDSRPNYLFVEYLKYPREVLATVSGTKLPELIAFTLIAVSIGWLVTRWLRKDPRVGMRVPLWYCLAVTPVLALLMLAMIRSTLAHRPINPSNAAFSQDSMVNQLPLNSPYSVLYAVYERRKEASNERIRYGYMEDQAVMDIILQEAAISPGQQIDPLGAPTMHQQVATRRVAKPFNLVIVLEESLGAEFVGALGGKDLTPNLDGLAGKGIWFERMYATGIRSARGIEAIITGFTPSPRTNVVKRSDTQDNFFTLAALLEKQGYQTSFIYGGESHFDNMRRFFLNNGFQTVIDQNDYEDPVFQGAWGLSDEDLFNRAHEEFSKYGDQPFFSLVFTTSHHEPFDIPENRVTQSEYGLRETSIKYADYALGYFLDLARNSNYWDNTVFMVVADHNAKIFGGKLVPVERFRIPAVIFGPGIEPRRVSGITSQIDIVPTLLSLIGIDSVHPAIGRDLTLPEYAGGSGRALMQFHANQAYIEGERVVVFQPDKDPSVFRLGAGGAMESLPEGDPELVRKALAYALWGPLTIRDRAYHP